MATVSDATLRREFYAAALTGLLASGQVIETDKLVDGEGKVTSTRVEGVALLTHMAATIADQAVTAFKAPKA